MIWEPLRLNQTSNAPLQLLKIMHCHKELKKSTSKVSQLWLAVAGLTYKIWTLRWLEVNKQAKHFQYLRTDITGRPIYKSEDGRFFYFNGKRKQWLITTSYCQSPLNGQFWGFEFFESSGKFYCIVQNSQKFSIAPIENWVTPDCVEKRGWCFPKKYGSYLQHAARPNC